MGEIKAWVYFAIGAIILVLASYSVGITGLYLKERDKLVAYKASVKTLAEEAERKAQEEIAKQKKTLQEVKDEYEAKLPEIRKGAVDAYRAELARRVRQQPRQDSNPVPAGGTGLKVDDGRTKECVLDQQFIEDAADDATKLRSWQEWCRKNNCPIE